MEGADILTKDLYPSAFLVHFLHRSSAYASLATLTIHDTLPPLQVYHGLLSDYTMASRGAGALLSQNSHAPGPTTLSEAYSGLHITLPLLSRASATVAMAQGGDTTARRLKVLEDWTSWSSLYPSGMQPSLATCRPAVDVLCFLQYWRETHHGVRRPADPDDYLPEVAPSTLEGVKSHLSVLCQALGRQGTWSEANSDNNPTAHPDVADYLTGYAHHCHVNTPYVATAAVPLTLAKHLKIISYLDARAEAALGPIARATFLRDLCLEAYLWETGQRGKEAGNLLITDLTYGDTWCTPAFPSICAESLRPALPIYIESSRGTKSRKTKHPGTLTLQRTADGDGHGLLISYLPKYAKAMSDAGSPLVGLLFKPLAPSQTRFEERPYTSGAYSARLKCHLIACSTWDGESAHSVRRGSTQALKASGASTSEIAEQRLWARDTTVDLYLHASRHKRRLVAMPLTLAPEDLVPAASEDN